MVVTPLVLRLEDRYPTAQWRRLSTWGAYLATGAATGAVYSAWVAGWEQVLNPWTETSSETMVEACRYGDMPEGSVSAHAAVLLQPFQLFPDFDFSMPGIL